MKKIILLTTVFICCLQFCMFFTQAQTLYGTTFNGGNEGAGTINKFTPSTNKLIVAKDLGGADGAGPSGNLVQASDGMLYGMTYAGGSSDDQGVIFSFDPSSSTYTKLKDFDYADGINPSGGLIQASDGKLYGMTSEGGNGYGVIFSFDPSSSTYAKLKDFKVSSDGRYPIGNLTQASDGKLYGMTSEGGSGYGVIFSFDPSTSIYTKLKNFGGNDGIYPYGSLMQANDGKLYGMALYGGRSFLGVIFCFDPSSNTYTKVKDFDDGSRGNNGSNPYGSLIQASDGKLYGMTYAGGNANVGVIFSLDPSSSTYTKLKDFDITNGANPYGSVMQASDGKLYGMTLYGGSSNLGVIFSFDPLTSTYTKMQDYTGANGANPDYGSAFIELKESNKAPIVKISSPTNNAPYTAPARIKINAAASDEDGTVSKVEFYNGTTLVHTEHEPPYDCILSDTPAGNYAITAKATDNSGNVTTSDVVNITVVSNVAPTVKVKTPFNNASFTAPANITLSADANDVDGRILTVDFYNGNTLIFSENAAPYYRKWFHVPVGNYSITARATDNNGVVTTSAAVNISVVPDVSPTVKITSPVNGASYTAPATIELSADASDTDGIVRRVDFYNGNTLLFAEKYLPYSKTWVDVPEGNYSITAIATDNNGKATISAPVAISVGAAGKSVARRDKLTSSNKPLSLNVSPNPVAKSLNISIEGLQVNDKSFISVLSVSGVMIKAIQSNTLNKKVQLDVSSLSAGVYYVKVINGDKILYKQFVKL